MHPFFISYLASRKAQKEEEKRAREKVRQKLEADKVSVAIWKKYFCYSMCMRQGYAWPVAIRLFLVSFLG